MNKKKTITGGIVYSALVDKIRDKTINYFQRFYFLNEKLLYWNLGLIFRVSISFLN